MRPVLYILSFLAVLASAFWAYRENYATQGKLKEIAGLQAEIAALREGIAFQRAEWAYLNRPDRLRELCHHQLRPPRPSADGTRTVRHLVAGGLSRPRQC